MMKILVIGGMHGNEPLGIKVVKLFQQNPAKDVDVVFANERAIEADCRFLEQDLNRSFPGKVGSKDYELRRAAQLLKMTKSYDLVLDFHNTHCPNNDCGFLGQAADKSLYSSAMLLGLSRIIVADYDCINKYASNCLSIEISIDSKQNNPEIWYDRIVMFSRLNSFDADIRSVEKYRFVYRMTLEDRDKFDLPNKNLKAFVPLSSKLADKMSVSSPAYPIFIADKFTPCNYGGLLNKLQ